MQITVFVYVFTNSRVCILKGCRYRTVTAAFKRSLNTDAKIYLTIYKNTLYILYLNVLGGGGDAQRQCERQQTWQAA